MRNDDNFGGDSSQAISLECAVANLLQHNGGLVDSLEGSDTYVMVRRQDFEQLVTALQEPSQ